MVEWYVFVLFSAILISFTAIITKKVLKSEHATEFSSVFAIFNFLISLIFLPKVQFDIGGNILLIIYLASVLGTIAFLLGAKATKHMELSAISPFYAFAPAITLLLAFLFLGEGISARDLVGISLLILGAYVLQIDFKVHDLLSPIKKIIKSKYIHFIFFSLFLFGFTAVIDRFLLNTSATPINPETYLFFIHLFIAINYILIMLAFDKGIHGIEHGIIKQGKWILLASVLIVGSRYFFMLALTLPGGKVALVESIKRSSIFLTILLGGELFKEHNLRIKLLASVIMLVGGFFIVT